MTKCPRCMTGNKVGPRIVTPEMHHDVVAEWCDNEGCEYWVERPATALDYGKHEIDPVIQPNIQPRRRNVEKILAEYEDIFGRFRMTERDWLIRRLSEQTV